MEWLAKGAALYFITGLSYVMIVFWLESIGLVEIK